MENTLLAQLLKIQKFPQKDSLYSVGYTMLFASPVLSLYTI